MADNDLYPTADLAFASYLVSEGFPEPDIELTANERFPNGFKATFLFKDGRNLRHYVHLWNTAQATGNYAVFLNAMRNLRKRMRAKIRVSQL